jgi:hypothetical protein
MSLVLASRRDPFSLMELESGNESVGDQHRNRPPHHVGILLAAGHLERALSGLLPRPDARPARVRAGLANAPRKNPLSLGRRRWAGLRGELSLAPSQGPIPLSYFRFLFFRWDDASGAHVIGIHDWEPFGESVRTLHALVERLAPAAASPLAYRARARARGGVAMARTPAWLLGACRGLRTRPICPRQIPAAEPTSIDVFYEPDAEVGPSPTARADWLSAEWGVAYGNEPTRNRPPRFVHLDFKAGAVGLARRFRHPSIRARDGLMRDPSNGEAGAGPIPLGRPRWAGRRGVLVLGDCFGNHLCFRWRERGVGYQIDCTAGSRSCRRSRRSAPSWRRCPLPLASVCSGVSGNLDRPLGV